MNVTLLGPQRRPTLQHAVADLPGDALVATVTAGWQEREPDDTELDAIIGRPTVNLALHARWLAVLEHDREYAHAEREHDSALAELRQLYLEQLDHALRAAYGVAQHKDPRPRLRQRALEDAIAVVRLLDEQHELRVREAQEAFYAAWAPQERPSVAHHREEVRRQLGHASAVVLAGGHVGQLTRALHFFHVRPHLPDRVIAWSAGAMALTDRLVLFHDHVPHGVAQTEVFGDGLGVVSRIVALPHARRRLRVDDPVRMSVLARRFRPARCVVLDDGARVDLGPGGALPVDAKIVGEDGAITAVVPEPAS